MDPEQIYQEVLQEEQQKGSSAAVAEGRAKAARQRAVHGSPHPKEAKWWPGSQPQFEGGDAAPAAEAEAEPAAPEPEPEAEAAPEAAPAAEGPDEVLEPDAAPAGAPPAAPAEQPPASQPAQEPAAAAAAATPTTLPPERRPAGVSHGTTSGTRLRPEDQVSTEAQFEGQRAMYDRRKLIDDLVATGVPAVAAAETSRRGGVLALAYIVVPILAVAFLISNNQSSGGETTGGETPPPGDGGMTIVAEGVAFDTETLTLPAGEEVSLEFDNRDQGTVHNVAIYENEADAQAQGNALFDGQDITGPATTTYEFEAPPPGEYLFQCDVHPDMNGTVVAE